jgi:tetratricopeptide (TPR) repeat protein
MLLPVIGFLNIYFFRYSFVADHYQYFAMIGVLCLLVGLLFYFLKDKAVFLIIAAAGGLAFLSWKQMGIYKNQETLWRDTLARNPACAMAESNWGYYLAEEQTRLPEALEHYTAALKLNPNDAGTRNNYGVALVASQRVEDGVNQFEEALKISPKNVFALQSLAWLRATSKHASIYRPADAVPLARRGVEASQGKDEWMIDTLAAALAAAGNFDEAISTQQRAIELVRQKRNPSAEAEMQQRLQLYRAGRPFREGDQ